MDKGGSDSSYDSEEAKATASGTSKKRKFVYKQKFRSSWLDEFKPWLKAPATGSLKPSCSACNCEISNAKTAIDRHGKSASHLRAISVLNSQPKLVFANQSAAEFKMLTEAKIAAFLAENNLPFSLSDSLVLLLKSVRASNSAETSALQNLRMGATKCTNIVRQGLGVYFSKDLVNILRVTKFSIIPDETTDIGTTKQLAMCVVYFDYEKFETVTSFFDAIEITKCDAESIYTAIKKSIIDKNIPMENIIGFSSDTCNVMFGEKKSVVSLMKQECSSVTFVKCSCHLIHLCVSHACIKLSTSLEDLCRNVYSYFSRSSLKQHELKEFQIFTQISPHKILAFGQTRWLSLEQCVNRLLEQWDALLLYFTSVINEKKDPSYVTESILHNLKNPFIKAQLEFVQVQLHRTNEFNTLFQSEQPMLYALHEKVCQLIKDLMSDFVKIDTVRNSDPLTLDVHNKRVQVPTLDVYVGINATQTLSVVSRDKEAIVKFKNTCVDFLVELIDQIRLRFNTSLCKPLQFLKPENALKLCPPSLANVMDTYPYVVSDCNRSMVDLEWRKLGMRGDHSDIHNVADFWKLQLSEIDSDGTPTYPNLAKLVGSLLSLPHSNAAVERIFSQLQLIKTDLRNSLTSATLVSLLHTKYGLKKAGVSAHDLQLNADLLSTLKSIKSNLTSEESNKKIGEALKNP